MIGQGARHYGQGAAPSEICRAGTLLGKPVDLAGLPVVVS